MAVDEYKENETFDPRYCRITRDPSLRKWNYVKELRAFASGALCSLDILAVVAGAVVAFWLVVGGTDLPKSYWGAILIAVLLIVNLGLMAGMYRYAMLRKEQYMVVRIGLTLTIAGLVILTVCAMLARSEAVPELFGPCWAAVTMLLMAISYRAAHHVVARLARSGLLVKQTAIVGVPDLAEDVAQRVEAMPDTQVVGIFSNHPAPGLCGDEDELLSVIRRMPIDEVIIATPICDESQISPLMVKLAQTPVDVLLCPGFLDVPAFQISGQPLPLLPVFRRPFAGASRMLKRLEDLCIAIPMLILLSPVMAVIAAAIKYSSPGPVFFRQRRAGRNEEIFHVYKFRSMRAEPAPAGDVKQAQRGDPRITRVGAFLRRTNLDELPQLINVLLGDMSVVGPRPHAVEHNAQYRLLVPLYDARHRVKPGITGWAQVNGLRGGTETVDLMRQRVNHDLFYVAHWSILFDIRILFLTVFSKAARTNAY